jgi:hypothetical protein
MRSGRGLIVALALAAVACSERNEAPRIALVSIDTLLRPAGEAEARLRPTVGPPEDSSTSRVTRAGRPTWRTGRSPARRLEADLRRFLAIRAEPLPVTALSPREVEKLRSLGYLK